VLDLCQEMVWGFSAPTRFWRGLVFTDCFILGAVCAGLRSVAFDLSFMTDHARPHDGCDSRLEQHVEQAAVTATVAGNTSTLRCRKRAVFYPPAPRTERGRFQVCDSPEARARVVASTV
jgi:hypothetical protein